MHCLNCQSSSVEMSSPLAIHEQRGDLEGVSRFALCEKCGNVMTEKEGVLCSTEHITDEEVIKLSFLKLFSSGTKPNAYALTENGAKQQVHNLLTNDAEITVVAIPEPNNEAIDCDPDITYPHANKEPRLNVFGKIDHWVADKLRFIKKLFKKSA